MSIWELYICMGIASWLIQLPMALYLNANSTDPGWKSSIGILCILCAASFIPGVNLIMPGILLYGIVTSTPQFKRVERRLTAMFNYIPGDRSGQ